MALTLQFVDSVASSPTVRLNLNSAPWTTKAETEFGAPEMRYAAASTLLADGERISASAYGNRTLTLRLYVDAGSVDATATQVQTLVRELDRPTNLLKTQLGSSPVFFRTWRSAPGDWRIITDGASATVDVAVLAEPFALGLIQTPISAQTLDTDPANANGNFLDATGIIGDVEAPAIIRWPATAIAANRESLFAVRRRGTPSSAPFLFQAEAQTNGTDTTDQADAAFSGGNGVRCTFATNQNMATRSTISDLGTAGINLRGRYRVFARYTKTTSGDGINMRIQWGTSGGTVTTNDSYACPSGTTDQIADLGEIQVPRGVDPIMADDGVEIPASDTYHLALQAEQTSGTGDLDVDYLILVPADDRLAVVKWVEAGPSYWKLNARDGSVYAFNGSDQIATAATPGLSGGLPMLTPNQTNRLYMVYEVGSGLTTTLTTIAVTVQYYPRYIHVRPSAT